MLLVSILSACDDSKSITPTPIQATVEPAVTIERATTEPTASSVAATSVSADPATPVAGSDPASAYSRGQSAMGAGNYDAAIAAFTEVIAAVPDYEPAYYARGAAHAAKNEADAALADLYQASSLQPEDPQPVLLGGIILHQSGRSDEALQALSYAIQLGPALPDGYYWRAVVLLAQKATGDALDDLNTVVKLAPTSQMGQEAAAAIQNINGGGSVDPIQPAPLPTPLDSQPPAPVQPAATSVAISGQVVADLGFRPEKDGFKFENWGFAPDRTDLSPNDLRRMFGDQVCASLQGDKCILTPAGQAWMDEKNQGMQGGHCEGFAALSLIFYQGKEDPNKFGAATTHDLKIDGNVPLQREIAYYWATQTVRPTNTTRAPQTPAELIDTLTAAFKAGPQATQTYTIEFWKRGYKDGHAVTPYAVADIGGGKYAIKIYDNNHPGDERLMILDKAANTWSYDAAINPNEPDSHYEGDATTQTLMLTPTDIRLTKQACPFCLNTAQSRSAGMAAPEGEYNTIYLDGNAHLLITAQDGKHTGFLSDDNFVNEIPGVDFEPVVSTNLYKDSVEPIYYVPVNMAFSIAVVSTDPVKSTVSTVSMIGPGYVLSVKDLVLQPGESDTLDFSDDGTTVTYRTQYSDSPDILLGTETQGADYAFLVKGVDLGNGGTVKIYLDHGTLAIDTIENSEPATYGLVMYRIDSNGEQLFAHDGITLLPNDIAHLDYEQWNGDGSSIPLKIDHNGDGTDDETIDLTDAR